MPFDEACAQKGVPTHLHRCDKPTIDQFDAQERLFRRFPPAHIAQHIANAVSFDRQNSSVVRSQFSTPDDARWDAETGAYRAQHGVISFPACVYQDRTWESNEEPVVEVRIALFHDPLQCNYAHSDFHFFENGNEVSVIARKSVKMKIRDMLRPLIQREL